LKLELVRAVHASRNIKHAGNFRKDYLLGAELQEHILRFSEIKYVWRYSVPHLRIQRTRIVDALQMRRRIERINATSQPLLVPLFTNFFYIVFAF